MLGTAGAAAILASTPDQWADRHPPEQWVIAAITRTRQVWWSGHDAAGGEVAALHCLEQMRVQSADRQALRALVLGVQLQPELACLVAGGAGNGIGPHHSATVDLPEALGVELRQQVFERPADPDETRTRAPIL
jgi:hypothetical protein